MVSRGNGTGTVSGIKLRNDLNVTCIQQVGDDATIASAARVSTSGVTEASSDGMDGLIGYLMKHRHGSPFEHGSLTVAIEAPIFVAREFMRHRVGWSYSEASARYMDMEPEFYVPTEARPLAPTGSSARPTFTALGKDAYHEGVRAMTRSYENAYGDYEYLLDLGWAREIARGVLGTGIYTSWYATANPRSIMHFLSLRTHSEDAAFVSYPQWEIEQVAQRIEKIFSEKWPITHQKWVANGRVAP